MDRAALSIAGRVAAAAVMFALAACARPTPEALRAAAASPPYIAALQPERGPAGLAYPFDVTISGSGFAPAGNIVRFGPVTLPDLRSTDGGARIVFAAPKAMPAAGEAPPLVLPAGTYAVTVETPHGISNTVRFEFTADGP